MSEAKTGLALLREPFKPHQISQMCRSTKKDNPKGKCSKCGGWHGLPSVQLSYVGHAALTDRLLDADPAWTWEPLTIGQDGLPTLDKNGGMWIKLTVCGVTRFGYGDAQNRTGGDGVKEMIGDALRNAAMRFGAALDLWHKGELHVEDEEPAKESAKSIAQAEREKLPPEQQHKFADLHTEVMDEFNSKGAEAAYDMYEQIRDNLADPGEVAAFRGLFDSKVRTAFTKIYNERKPQKEAA